MKKQKIINKQWGEFALNNEPRNYWEKYIGNSESSKLIKEKIITSGNIQGLTEKIKENKIKWQKKKKLITTKNGIIIAWQWEAIK